MANGVSGTKGGGNAAQQVAQNTAPISTSSTGGKIVDQGGGQWYGEIDNGAAVAINDLGKEDINLYKYGNKQVYEVQRYLPDGSETLQKQYAFTKSEAMNLAKGWLKANQGTQH